MPIVITIALFEWMFKNGYLILSYNHKTKRYAVSTREK
jgi:hypothetical protein